MEKRQDTRGRTPGYKRSGVNFFGRRAKASDTAPRGVQGEPGTQDAKTWPTAEAALGKPYYPSNGHQRHLNVLGRSSLERSNRLLTNR